MGAAVAAAGFIVILLISLVGLMIFIGLWFYRRRYLKNSPNSKIVQLFLNSLMVIMIAPTMMLIFSSILIKIDNIALEKSRLEAIKKRYIQLETSLLFGEITIPKNSWVNLNTPIEFPIEELADIRQGITKVRFSKTVEIAGVPAAAIEIVNDKLYLEIAEDTHYQSFGKTQSCSQGWILKVEPTNSHIMKSRYEDLTGSWFTPSLWNADVCYQSTAAIIVLALNDQYGIYALDHTPRLEHDSSVIIDNAKTTY